MNLLDYFSKDHVIGEVYDKGVYRKVEIKPEISDIEYLRPFKFINLTFRGTVEFRSVCTQPISDSMSVAAFHVGLKDKLDELEELITNDTVIYHKGYTATELRKLLIKDDIPAFINMDELCKLSKDVVDISKQGLQERGIGEEIFLKPLYERIKCRTNPGKNMIIKLNDDTSLETMIEEYGKISRI
jgi:gamma-glutamylcysteine synthetase